MQRISTPTREIDKFGPGKDGYKGGGPPDATQLEPAVFDANQEEISGVIEGQGTPLDPLNLNQMKEAIDDYAFVDPTITGSLTVESGGDIHIESGGTLTADIGSTCTFNGDVIVGGLASFNVNCDATFANNVTLGDVPGVDVVTCNAALVAFGVINIQSAGILLNGGEIDGSAGSLVSVEDLEASRLELFDVPIVAASFDNGTISRVDTVFMGGQGSIIRAIDDSSKGYDGFHQAVNAIDNTDAGTTRLIQFNEQVLVLVFFDYQCDVAPTNMNIRIRITGPLGQVEPDISTLRADDSPAVYAGVRAFLWRPTDSWPAENATQPYAFLFRAGTGAGTAIFDNIAMLVFPALEVP